MLVMCSLAPANVRFARPYPPSPVRARHGRLEATRPRHDDAPPEAAQPPLRCSASFLSSFGRARESVQWHAARGFSRKAKTPCLNGRSDFLRAFYVGAKSAHAVVGEVLASSWFLVSPYKPEAHRRRCEFLDRFCLPFTPIGKRSGCSTDQHGR